MTTMHPARKRLLLGVLLLAGTFFYTFAPTCGLIGVLVSRASSKLLGQTGSTLLALTMLVVGILFVLPHDAIGRLFRWAFQGREARVSRVVREGDSHAEVRRIVAEALKTHLALEEKPTVPLKAPEEKLSFTDRRRLTDVRGALKQLGCTKDEIEPLVAKMDPTQPAEVLLRGALKELQPPRAGKNN